jgi:predicted DNA-binding transcriptional regulator YafY
MKTDAKKVVNIFRIFDILSYNEPKHIDLIAQKLDVSPRTVIRYLNDIEDGLNSYFIFDRSKEGIKLNETEFVKFINQKDDYYVAAAVLSSDYRPLTQGKNSYNINFAKIINEQIEMKNLIDREFLKLILQSIFKIKGLNIKYQTANHGIMDFRIQPLKFVFQQNIPYIISYDFNDKNNCLKTIAVDKITEMNLSEKTLSEKELNKNLDYINSAWGITFTDKITDVVFEVSNRIIPYFKKSLAFDKQKIEYKKDTAFITLPVHKIEHFVRWALRFGENLTIISPPEAVREMKKFLKQMTEKYK